jgi:hypothetical protein
MSLRTQTRLQKRQFQQFAFPDLLLVLPDLIHVPVHAIETSAQYIGFRLHEVQRHPSGEGLGVLGEGREGWDHRPSAFVRCGHDSRMDVERPQLRPFQVEVFAEFNLGQFGDGVRRAPRDQKRSRDAGRVDQRPSPFIHPQKLMRDIIIPLHIRLQVLPPDCWIDFADHGVLGESRGCVDHDVDVSESGYSGVEGRADGFRVCDVGFVGEDLVGGDCGPEAVGGFFQAALRAADEDEARGAGGEPG